MTFFHSPKAFLSRLRSRASIDPVRDWLLLVTVAGIAFAGIIVWNVWAFDKVAEGGTLRTPVMQTSTSLTNSSLDNIHSIFENRAAEEAKYRTGTYRFTDPSQ